MFSAPDGGACSRSTTRLTSRSTTCRLARGSSWPASRWTNPPRAGSQTPGVPIIDNYWQTETGWPILGPSQWRGAAEPHQQVRLARQAGLATTCAAERNHRPEITQRRPKGVVTIEPAAASCLQTVWGDDDALSHLLDRHPRPPGLFHLRLGRARRRRLLLHPGRTDDVINVAGHRLGARDRGEHLQPPGRRRGGRVGVADQLKGQVALALRCCVTPCAATPEDVGALEAEVMKAVDGPTGRRRAALARAFVSVLPKTRSGKLLRRALRPWPKAATLATSPPSTTPAPWPRSSRCWCTRVRRRAAP